MATTITKEEFRAIRDMIGETQEEFAERLGYKSFNTVLRKEKGWLALSQQDEIILAKYLAIIREKAATNEEDK